MYKMIFKSKLTSPIDDKIKILWFCNYLELFIDSPILAAIVVGHNDVQRVRTFTGQLVKLVQADPDLSWKNVFVILSDFLNLTIG